MLVNNTQIQEVDEKLEGTMIGTTFISDTGGFMHNLAPVK